MKSVRIHSYGNADQLKLEEVQPPPVRSDQVLVKIHDAGVNPLDWKIRSGQLKDWIPAHFPLTMGQDFSGEVAQVGDNVTQFSKGDRVFGFAKGSYAEYAALSTSNLAQIPNSIDFETAASLPTAGLTAYQIIVNVAQAAPGKTILIHGAAGGVGSFAVQIALWRGATVIGTASEKDIPYLKSMGVGQIIDYRKEHFENLVRDVDVVVDLVGGETQTRSYQTLKKGGLLITTVGLVEDASKLEGIQTSEFMMKPNASELAELAKLVDQRIVKPRLSHVIPIQEAKKAQELNETGKSHGKIVLKIA